MKVMGILAVLVGALEALNVTVELMAGMRSGRTGSASLMLAVAGLAALLLLSAGVGMLTRPRNAARFAGGAALFCLVVFAGIAAVRPIFSIAGSLLGIGFPIALLLFLYRDLGRGPSAATR